MAFPTPAMAIDAPGLLAAFAHAGTALTIAIFVSCAFLATRCEGCCREDEIFRPDVI
jgi:hypothetical protein